MKIIRIFAIVLVAVGLCAPVASAQADEAARPEAISAAGLLNADGTLKLDGKLAGTLDISGYDVSLDPQRGPVLSPEQSRAQNSAASLATYGDWAAVGDGGGVVDGIVRGMAVDGGNVYVVGDFTNLNNIPEADYVAKWNGSSWSALGSSGWGDGAIDFYTNTVAVDSATGNVYVGGDFYHVRDSGNYINTAAKIAEWDGSHWSGLGSDGAGGASLNNTVYAIAVSGSNVYVGGSFTDVKNGTTTLDAADYIARWDGANWSALGSDGAGGGSLHDAVRAIAVFGTHVYAGGYFTDVNNGGTSLGAADYIADWNGSNWAALGNNGSGEGALSYFVYALATDGSGNLYAGGQFSQVFAGTGSAIPGAQYIAKWTGSAWLALGTDGAGNGSLNNTVWSILVSGTDVYVGGGFTNANDNGAALPAADYVARWDGTDWFALGSNGAGNGSIPNKSGPIILALAKVGSNLIAGGAFYDVSDGGSQLLQADFIAQWDGANWSSVGTDTNGALTNGYLSSEVNAIAVRGTTVYVGGVFQDVSNHGDNLTAADYVAKWDGTDWSALGSDGSGDGAVRGDVYALALDSLGNLYVGGSFTHVNNNGTDIPEAEHIAKWNGSSWSAMGNVGQGHGSLNGIVDAIAASGTNVYVGGGFTNVQNNGTALLKADYIAKWNGSSWSALGGGSSNGSLNGQVSAIAVSGANVYAGGSFTNVKNGATTLLKADYIAKWDGTSWSALGGGSTDGSLNSFVSAIAVSGTSVYAGGNFTDVKNGTTTLGAADYIAKWNGTSWSALGHDGGAGGSLNSRVVSIAVDASGVYAAGYFYDVNDKGTLLSEADLIARWNGTEWSALGGNGSGNGVIATSNGGTVVYALAVSGTDLLIGGQFSDPTENGTVVKSADYLAAYGIQEVGTATSEAAKDGWIPETGENTNAGGAPNSTDQTIRLGDNSVKKQYRSVLSFSTDLLLPDDAIITKVTLRLMKQGITGGGNPITLFQGLLVDLKKGYFGTSANLQAADFQAATSGTAGPFKPALSSGWYSVDLTAAKASINKVATNGGVTQIRLRFALDDNGDAIANYLSLYSGNAADPADAPQLIIKYYEP